MDLLSSFNFRGLKYVFTDIDGTLTADGRLPAESYSALWRLHSRGLAVIAVTGRPAGWCDLIARFWPVHGVIGENGGLYFSYRDQKMRRRFAHGSSQRRLNRKKLQAIATEVRRKVPGSRIAADQFCRMFDLAIDFAEDVKPLPKSDIRKIKEIFEQHGAHAKVSNIHVNGWFGDYDKLHTCKIYCKNELGFDLAANLDKCAFIGDSPNDEPMFEFFKWSFGVRNIVNFQSEMKFLPRYVAEADEAQGFKEIADRLLTVL